MISNQTIKDKVKKHAEQQVAPAKECPRCGAIGMKVGEVVTVINLAPKPFTPKAGGKPRIRDADTYRPEMVCPNPHSGHRFVEPND